MVSVDVSVDVVVLDDVAVCVYVDVIVIVLDGVIVGVFVGDGGVPVAVWVIVGDIE
jgi:hypothetical protein